MDNCTRPPTRTVVPPEPHASRGIGKPYPKEYREQMMLIIAAFYWVCVTRVARVCVAD